MLPLTNEAIVVAEEFKEALDEILESIASENQAENASSVFLKDEKENPILRKLIQITRENIGFFCWKVDPEVFKESIRSQLDNISKKYVNFICKS